ncbi:hypothetical protein FOZ63_030320, partial [Perkinsus olseni]
MIKQFITLKELDENREDGADFVAFGHGAGGLSGKKYSTQKAGQDCLNKNLLVRPDLKTRPECRNARAIDARNYDCQPLGAAHPERWYLHPRSYATDGMNYKMKFKLPDNLT